MARKRFVLDTNVLVSGLLFNGSTPHRAILKAETEAILLAWQPTLAELQEVLLRPKFDRAADMSVRMSFFQEYVRRAKLVTVYSSITVCRHPNDDKFLELAVDDRANLILTGDKDLLALHPFRSIPILTPTQYLQSITD